MSGGKSQKSNKKNSYERCLAGVKACNFSLSCRSRDDPCQQHDSICDNDHHELMSIVKNTRGVPENAEKGLQAIPAHS